MEKKLLENRISLSALIFHTITYCNKKAWSYTFWLKPESSEVFFLIDTSKTLIKGIPSFENNEAYFAVSAFENEGLEKTILLQPDILFTFCQDKGVIIENATLKKELALTFIESCSENIQPKTSNPIFIEEEEIIKNRFIAHVQEALSQIENGFFDKVVLSESFNYNVTNFNPAELFSKIIENNTHAFVNLICLKGKEVWIGVTPEKLLSKDKNGLIHTVALAATQAFNPNIEIKDATWSGKEIEEQALVSRYIINCFKKLRLREYQDFGPYTVKAGNLLHLKTDFYFNTKEVEFPNLAYLLLSLLHPTSAVCGMPLAPAFSFIKDIECHSRELYCGFIGPVNILGESSLFVNLRCLKYENSTLHFFAGAGITSSSNPENEYKEIKNKSKILLDYFK